MSLDRVWTLLHLFFAFGYVGTLVVADWNGRAARATADWGRRAALYEIIGRASRVAGVGSLLLLGVFGNLLAASLGYRMGADAWLRWVNGLWLVTVLVQVFVCLPSLRRIETAANAAARGAAVEGYDILRLAEYPLALVVSDAFKHVFEGARCTGYSFEALTLV